MQISRLGAAAFGLGWWLILAGSASAAPANCQGMSFERWLEAVKQEALAQGISRATLASALPQMTYDAGIVRRDHGQGVFQQSVLQFSDRMVSRDPLTRR